MRKHAPLCISDKCVKFGAARQAFGVRLQVATTLRKNFFEREGISRHILQMRAESRLLFRLVLVEDLGSLGTSATAGGSGTTTASLRTATTAALEGTARSLVGTAATASGATAATLEEGSVVLGAALLDGDGVFTDGDGAGLESGLVSINGLEVDKGAVLFASQSLLRLVWSEKLTLGLLASKYWSSPYFSRASLKVGRVILS
jgi:hypothetical protein